MNCQQVKKYIYAFLDNRTDLELNLGIQEHMEGCGNCSREFRIEDKISRILNDLSIWESCPQEVTDRMHMVINNIESERKASSIWDYRKSLGLKLFAIAASILLFVSLSILIRSYTTITKLPIEIKQIASDHSLKTNQMALDIVSSDVQSIRNELLKKVQFEFVMPKFTTERLKIVGGRVCIIDGKKGAHIVYRIGANLVSFYALPDLKLDFSSMKSFELKGINIYKAEYEGQRIFIWKQGAIYCAFVSTLGEDRMMEIVSSVIEEGLA